MENPKKEIGKEAQKNLESAFLGCKAIQSVMTKGVLRGGGDTKFLMKADILFIWMVPIPLGALGGLVFHWPVYLTAFEWKMDP